jgi:hypothetical protein
VSRGIGARRSPASKREARLSSIAGSFFLLLLAGGCASSRITPATPEETARTATAWSEAMARADLGRDANVLYDATMSQGVISRHGTLAVKLRGESVEGSLSGPLGVPVATYADGVLRGEKIEPVRIAPRQLRAVLSGVWTAAPDVAGRRGTEMLLRWPEPDAAEGRFDVAAGQLVRLTVRRPEGELEAVYSGARKPWPEKITIEEKRTGSRLSLKLLSRETPS